MFSWDRCANGMEGTSTENGAKLLDWLEELQTSRWQGISCFIIWSNYWISHNKVRSILLYLDKYYRTFRYWESAKDCNIYFDNYVCNGQSFLFLPFLNEGKYTFFHIIISASKCLFLYIFYHFIIISKLTTHFRCTVTQRYY